MITSEEVIHYWNYAELINEELGRTTQYVEPDSDNYGTYSIVYTKILLSACSEIEVVCKLLCQIIDPEHDYVSSEVLHRNGNKMIKNMINMETLSSVLLQRFPHIYQAKTEILQKHQMIYPFACWETHNLVKHYRHNHFNGATLENALNSVAALIILNSNLYELVTGTYAPRMSKIGMFDNCYSYCGLIVQPSEKLPDM